MFVKRKPKQKIATELDELIGLIQNWNRSVSNSATVDNTSQTTSRKRNQRRVAMETKPAKKMKFNGPDETGPPMSTLDLLLEPRQKLASVARDVILQTFGVEMSDRDYENLLLKRIEAAVTDPTSVSEHGDIFLPCHALKKVFRSKTPGEIGQELGQALSPRLQEFGDIFQSVECADNGFINVFLQPAYLGRIVSAILNEENSFIGRLPPKNERVMVEYSQPNTHKAFHVGHMRNCALGDCLARIFEHCGFDAIPSNYFGDEGTHVAKCLWFLDDEIKTNGLDIDAVQVEDRGEFLGGIYTRAVQKLDWKCYTTYPYKNVRVAQVESVNDHPSPDAPANLHVVTVDLGNGEKDTVICGGTDYKEGDFIPHRFAETSKNFFGIESRGVIQSAAEMGVVLPPPAGAAAETGGKKKKKKKGKKTRDKRIWILNEIVADRGGSAGDYLADLGRMNTLPPDVSVNETCVRYEREVQDVLHGLENEDEYWTSLWQKTRLWSLDEFTRIYEWLGCRFDKLYYESECSGPSQQIVTDYFEQGVFVESNGCIGCELGKKLGFCMLRKTNGAGLYATKDLFLAKKKFEEEKIDRSIYVVDAGQTLHFAQVFAVLGRMGYEQAEKCHHEAYGQVRLPSGKMSSRTGTVQLFSSLRDELAARIETVYLSKLRETTDYSEEELQAILHAVSVGTIRYGMLNHDTARDVIFNLEEWLDPRGETGPYVMYQCARVSSIGTKVPYPENVVPDYSILNSTLERDILLNLAQFNAKVFDVIDVGSRKDAKMNPSGLCKYLYGISVKFSRWYSMDENNIKDCQDPVVKATRLDFVNSIALVLRTGLELLGITPLRRM